MMKAKALRLCGIGVAVLAALAVAACATISNPLSEAELQSIRISGVDVRYAPEAEVYWPEAEQNYVAGVQAQSTRPVKAEARVAAADITSGGGENSNSEYTQIAETPEARQHLRDRVAAMVKTQAEKTLLPHFTGTRDTRLEVTVHGFNIPPAVQRVVLGGQPMLAAVTVLKDSATGKELARLDRLAAGYAGNGLLGVALDQAGDDLHVRVLEAWGDQLRQWLLKR